MKFKNSGEPELRDIKGQMWRCDAQCWIDTLLPGRALRIHGPDAKIVAHMDNAGRLTVEPGYIFDGSSIPLLGRWLDSRTSAWPGCVHDILHEAMRGGKLPQDDFQLCVNVYCEMLEAFGAWGITSFLCGLGLELFGRASAKRAPEYPKRLVSSLRATHDKG